MGDERRMVWYWWLARERGCTWERSALTQTPNRTWETEGCPTCGGKFIGQVMPAPKVA